MITEDELAALLRTRENPYYADNSIRDHITKTNFVAIEEPSKPFVRVQPKKQTRKQRKDYGRRRR